MSLMVGKGVGEVVEMHGGERHQRATPARWSKGAVTWIRVKARVQEESKAQLRRE
jgi:hypothetical protein